MSDLQRRWERNGIGIVIDALIGRSRWRTERGERDRAINGAVKSQGGCSSGLWPYTSKLPPPEGHHERQI
jgi:hypothetical protein